MRQDFQPEEQKFTKDLDGMTLKMLQEHHKLYAGYVRKVNEIQTKLEAADKSEANGVFSFIGELKRQETFAVNGMKLHEVYFGHLGGNPSAGSGQVGQPKGELVKMIERDFGLLENWKVDMIATGLAARGWAILAFDYKDNKLHNYGSDAHNVGAVWGAIPIIVLDVYEHAYFMDYGVDRKNYINSFFKNLNWGFANRLVKEYGLENR
ncbi:MAG: superoxide dismutase, Fe-Mn family [Parcubacteria group bacterium Gr01-1014_3]|nr:MAG: superoxide dismutase, Fe-Mn family [Parcubacteria group bacterium Gr01-1014_3]